MAESGLAVVVLRVGKRGFKVVVFGWVGKRGFSPDEKFCDGNRNNGEDEAAAAAAAAVERSGNPERFGIFGIFEIRLGSTGRVGFKDAFAVAVVLEEEVVVEEDEVG